MPYAACHYHHIGNNATNNSSGNLITIKGEANNKKKHAMQYLKNMLRLNIYINIYYPIYIEKYILTINISILIGKNLYQ